MYAKMIYDPVPEIGQATHVLVKGRTGNHDICSIEDMTETIKALNGSPYKSYVSEKQQLVAF